ncbi:hypothetical protein EOI86_04495 [Hwanghaeella grinnelliae]|uniref:phosphoribosylglycinamide formyltransferase 1 n=1 Tax=Hwanghaeella grinnelliae TaxID=2500179 RepID=A0A437QVN0_9PROT|nr:formyltransferase family protein [Hwanghaeella grinnelliae]RVU38548.1 hypothetical protein EOI86_04495 [Hwanghaeella grinnelliae]
MAEQPTDMRVAVLTTETIHHCHFVREIAKQVAHVMVFEERRPISAEFDTQHEFEAESDAYELKLWFDGKTPALGDYAPTHTYHDINDPDCIQKVREFDPDAIIVYGTGRLSEELIDVRPDRIVNLHGANPEDYFGIDTHLWAIYHKDFDGLVSTLHRVESNNDRGGVVLSAAIPIEPDMEMHEFRAANTEVCVQLVMQGLHMLETFGQFISRPQNRSGRFYGFMPSVLKELCKQRFERYTSEL